MKGSQLLKKKPKKFKNINKNPQPEEKKPEKKKAQADIIKIDKDNKPKNKEINIDFIFGLIPLIIIVIFLAIFNLNNITSQKINENKLNQVYSDIKLSPFPILDKFTSPEISAQSAIITDAESKIVLYAKNPTLRFSMASTTKIMTALTALDYYKENSILTIYTPIVEGSHTGFEYGEQYSFKDLLYAMFLPSSNEAAYAVAENYPGGKTAFVQAMNEKAQKLNLANTHFDDPAGLDDDNNFTTVTDLSHMAMIAIKNNLIAGIVGTKQIYISDIKKHKQINLVNLNKLLGQDGVNGIKTGTTEGAGEVLVISKTENGHTFIVIVMKSKERYVDTKTLLTLISNNLRYITPEYPGIKY